MSLIKKKLRGQVEDRGIHLWASEGLQADTTTFLTPIKELLLQNTPSIKVSQIRSQGTCVCLTEGRK